MLVQEVGDLAMASSESIFLSRIWHGYVFSAFFNTSFESFWKETWAAYRNYNVLCDGEEKLFYIFSYSTRLKNTSEPSIVSCVKYCVFIIFHN